MRSSVSWARQSSAEPSPTGRASAEIARSAWSPFTRCRGMRGRRYRPSARPDLSGGPGGRAPAGCPRWGSGTGSRRGRRRGLEALGGVVGEHVFAGCEQDVDHRVAARHPLHDGLGREVREQVHDHRQRHVAADGQVMDEGQGEDDVRVGALQQAGALLLRPAQARAGVREVHDQGRRVGPSGGPQRAVVALGRGRVDIERQHPVAQVRGDAAEAPGVRAEVPAHPSGAVPGRPRQQVADDAPPWRRARRPRSSRGPCRRSPPIRCRRAPT